MIFREYGRTGKKLSILGFGGMRFQKIDDRQECVSLMVQAAEAGVNYFDTAPAYFGIKSEEVFGEGFAELRRGRLPFFCSTKTSKSSEREIRREIEGQLRRLGLPAVDFYHVWCVTSLEGWRKRKDLQEAIGAVEGFSPLAEQEMARIRTGLGGALSDLCTGCRYCDGCPEGIPIHPLMDAFNHKILYGSDRHLTERLSWHWDVSPETAGECTRCGQCESLCTQHLPIMNRLAGIAALAGK